MLLIFLWIVLSIVYVNYMVGASVLLATALFMDCVMIKSVIFLKYLILLVYLSGVVVSILYVSCTCVDTVSSGFGLGFVVVGFIVGEIMEKGVVLGADSFWMLDSVFVFMMVAWLFNLLVMVYMYSLFKISGSLRF